MNRTLLPLDSRGPIHVTHVIPDLDVGGAEMALYRLLSNLDKNRIKSSVVCLGDKGHIGNDIEANGIPVYYLPLHSGVMSLIKLIRLFIFLKDLKPDIIQGWMYRGNFIATVAYIFLRKRLILFWNVRSSGTELTENIKKVMFHWLIGKLSRFPNRIISNSIASTKIHEHRWNYPCDRWVIIPNGFDKEVFKPDQVNRNKVRKILNVGAKTILIGHVARYNYMKDHNNFLLAADHLVRSGADTQFVMVGFNVDQNNIEITRVIRELGLNGRVHLLGLRRDIPFLISGFDIGCLSSNCDEGFPNVIGEMMSSGIPCVVTDVGDCAQIVGNTGRVVSIRDPKRLAVALKELVDLGMEGRKKLGGETRQRVIEKFSLGSIVKRYEQLYTQVSEASRGN